MRTIAEKNRFETELRFTPSGSRFLRKTRKIAKWVATAIALTAVTVTGWIVWGVGKMIAQDTTIKYYHIIIALLILRWFIKPGNTMIKTIIAITLILILCR